MLKEKIQYINAIILQNNLDIDNKIIVEDSIIEQTHSSFIIRENMMPSDGMIKLQLLQKDISKNYLSSIVNSKDSKIIKKDELINTELYLSSKLNDNFNVAVSRNDVFELKYFFDKTGIDGIYSPFHILYKYIADKNLKNSLSMLTYDNNLYIIIFGDDILYSEVINLDQLYKLQECSFYNSELEKEQAFLELFYLEVFNSIKLALSNFYEEGNGSVFIEKINILYSSKNLTDKQIEELEQELLLKVDYIKVDFSNILFDIVLESDSLLQSFIPPRKEKKTKKLIVLFSILIGLIISSVFIYDFIKDYKKTDKVKIEQKVMQDNKFINNLIKNTIINNFDVLPNTVTLKRIEIYKDSSIIELNLMYKESFDDIIKNNILKYYKESKIEFLGKDYDEFKAKIINKGLKSKNNIPLIQYKTSKRISKKEIKEFIKQVTPFDTIISYINENKESGFVTYRYKVNMLLNSPKDFFNIIDKLNNSNYYINISYPLILNINKDKLEITAVFEFKQFL